MGKGTDEKKAAQERRHWGLKVEWSCYREVTREADPEDDYGADDIAESSTIERVRLLAEGESPDIVVCFEPKEGDEIHLVHVRYGTGDSFHSESGLMALVGAWRDPNLAQLACAEIRRGGSEESSLGVFDDDHKVMMVSPQWCGYFETLESVYAEAFEILPAEAPRARRRHG